MDLAITAIKGKQMELAKNICTAVEVVAGRFVKIEAQFFAKTLNSSSAMKGLKARSEVPANVPRVVYSRYVPCEVLFRLVEDCNVRILYAGNVESEPA